MRNLIFSAVLSSAPMLAVASESFAPVKSKTEVDIVVMDQSVNDFFRDVSSYTGSRIVVSDKVRGRVTPSRYQGEVVSVLERVAASANLDIFEFNGNFYISSRSEATTRLTRLGDLTTERALKALNDAGLPQAAFSVTKAADGAAILMSGPPKLLAFSEGIISSLPPEHAKRRSILVRRGMETSRVPIN